MYSRIIPALVLSADSAGVAAVGGDALTAYFRTQGEVLELLPEVVVVSRGYEALFEAVQSDSVGHATLEGLVELRERGQGVYDV